MAPTNEGKAEVLHACPQCKEIALHTVGQSGEDDYGQLEGEVTWCDKCDYTDEWAARC